MHKKYIIFGERSPDYNDARCTHPNTKPKMIYDPVTGSMHKDIWEPLNICSWLRDSDKSCGPDGSWWAPTDE